MSAAHICRVDCDLLKEGTRTIHMMHAAEPSSAAGRCQWEQNAAIKRQGRRAWRATGQGESREVRLWNRGRALGHRIGVRASRRFMASVGSPWSDEHTLRTFNTWVSEEGR